MWNSIIHNSRERRLFKSLRVLLLVLPATLLLSACAPGSLGDVLGGGGDDEVEDRRVEDDRLFGEITDVDTRGRLIRLELDRGNRFGDRRDVLSLYYDQNTEVVYRGNNYQPENLEVGDEIEAYITEDDNRLWVSRIEVLQDASPDDEPPATVSDVRDFDGVVRDVDTRRQVVELEPFGQRSIVLLRYDRDDVFVLRDREYGLDRLKAGDEVEATVLDTGRDFEIRSLRLIRSADEVSDNSPVSTDIEGIVMYVDERDNTITLESDNPLISSFDRGTDNRMVLRYDRATIVEFEGRRYAPTNLEPGDEIAVEVRRDGNDLWAEFILVTADVNERR